MRRLLSLFLLISFSTQAQTDCEDFISLLGKRDINRNVIEFKENCGPFEETIAEGKALKRWISKEKGIQIAFINREEDEFALPKFEVFTIELTSFTSKGGYEGNLPLDFKMGMDHKMVKNHIKEMENADFERGDLGKRRSYFNYSVSGNSSTGQKIRVYISQYNGQSITTMRLRLK